MSVRWFIKLSEVAPAPSAGYWRRLPADWQGKGPGGEPQAGRTWVRRRKSNMKSWFKPYKHQASFIKQTTSLKPGKGIIAAHGTGTGKTISSVAAFEELKKQGKASRALVIAPAGLRNNYLKKGVEKFTNSKGLIVKNADQEIPDDVDYVITSYAAFRKNPDAFLKNYLPDTIIADEMHRATNQSSSTHKALYRAAEVVPRFMGLTASIAQNDPSDIASAVRIATAGQAPDTVTNKKKFRKKYTKKVPTKQKGVFGGKVHEKRVIRGDELRKELGATIHYLEDLDADKKPRKETQRVAVKMSKTQVKLYREAMKGLDPKVRAKIAAGEPVSQKEAMHVFTKLLHARQVSNSLHAHVPKMSLEQAAEATPKIKKILDDVDEHIKSTSDSQVIIYTNIVKGGVDVIEAGLKKRGVAYGVFSGKGNKGVTEESRQQAVEDYQAGKNKVIVITGAGAEGLDLGNTTMVMLADGHYNPQRVAQAEARGIRAKGQSHRPKEKRKVIVRQYVSTIPRNFFEKMLFRDPEKSVGEWVYATAERKARANRQLRNVLENKPKKKERTLLHRMFGS